MLRACLVPIWCLLLIVLATGAARAQAGTVGQPVATCVRPDAPGLNAARLLRAPVGFDCATPQRAFGPGDYWVISTPLDLQVKPRAVVRTASVWQRRMTLYALYADGRAARFVTDQHAATRHLQLGAIIQRWLPRRDAAIVRLLWHVEGSANLRGIVLAPTVATPALSAQSNMTMAAIYAAFAGLCAALLLYNIGLARALRHTFLPLYCLMMVGMLLYALSSSGALAWLMPGIDNNMRLKTNYLLLAATGIAAVLFLRHFFEDGVMPRWLDRALRLACAAVALPTLLIVAVGPWQLHALDMAYTIGFAVLIAMSVPMIVCAWIKRSQYLGLFVLAWTAPIALATLRTAYGLDLIRYSFWLDNSTILSMAFEALLSSLAIAYRILLITRERDVARAQEITARMLADADPLTGLMNRRGFLREAIGRRTEQQLLLLDIDRFKRINDTIGHDGGDEVLRIVARVLRGAAGPETLVARIGGEEFALVTPSAHRIDADLLLATLRATRMPFDLTVTASIGQCSGPLLSEPEWKTMYCAADRALFEAKNGGRDRCRIAAAPGMASAIAA